MKKFSKEFTQISNFLINNISVSDGAFRTYLAIKQFKFGDTNPFPSEATLAQLRGKSIRTICEHLKRLKRVGLIRYKRRGYSASNQYELIAEENFTNKDTKTAVSFQSLEKETSVLSGEKLPLNNTKTKNTKINKLSGENYERKAAELREKLALLLREKPKDIGRGL